MSNYTPFHCTTALPTCDFSTRFQLPSAPFASSQNILIHTQKWNKKIQSARRGLQFCFLFSNYFIQCQTEGRNNEQAKGVFSLKKTFLNRSKQMQRVVLFQIICFTHVSHKQTAFSNVTVEKVKFAIYRNITNSWPTISKSITYHHVLIKNKTTKINKWQQNMCR